MIRILNLIRVSLMYDNIYKLIYMCILNVYYLQDWNMLIINEWTTLLTSGISVTFNPLRTRTEYHKSGLKGRENQ